jgi:hypothetical protein
MAKQKRTNDHNIHLIFLFCLSKIVDPQVFIKFIFNFLKFFEYKNLNDFSFLHFGCTIVCAFSLKKMKIFPYFELDLKGKDFILNSF